MSRLPFGPGTIVLGGGAVLLVGFLAVGFLLPSVWQADATVRVEARPGDIAPLLDSPEGWKAWTTWPDSGLTRSGPDRGPGARLAWSDREFGSGSFTIGAIEPAAIGDPDRGDEVASIDALTVRYAVEVAGAGGSVMRTEGTISLTGEGAGTVVRWREEGDLGGNPLMGYWARSMTRAQSAEMAKSLERLAEIFADSAGAGSAVSPGSDTGSGS